VPPHAYTLANTRELVGVDPPARRRTRHSSAPPSFTPPRCCAALHVARSPPRRSLLGGTCRYTNAHGGERARRVFPSRTSGTDAQGAARDSRRAASRGPLRRWTRRARGGMPLATSAPCRRASPPSSTAPWPLAQWQARDRGRQATPERMRRPPVERVLGARRAQRAAFHYSSTRLVVSSTITSVTSSAST
jgi:hypothetical protein